MPISGGGGSGGGAGAVSSVFTRTGAVIAASGDYTAAQVTNAADLSNAAAQVFTGNVQAPALIPSGLAGSTAAGRFVGFTASGAPAAGAHLVGDFVVTQTGHVFTCTAAGTPGTWVAAGSLDNLVTSVFARTGAVVATSGDYTAAQVTNAADKSSGSQQAFTGEVAAPDFTPTGLTGSVQPTRWVGATASGAPASGAHLVGDFVVAQNGHIFVCTAAGTPGTWVDVAGTAATGTNFDVTLGADVTLTPVNTFVDAVNSGAIGANGQVWLILAHCEFLGSAAGHAQTARVWDGTTVFAEGTCGAGSAVSTGVSLVFIRTLTGATTFTLRGASNTGTTDLIKANATPNSAGTNIATHITGVRLA